MIDFLNRLATELQAAVPAARKAEPPAGSLVEFAEKHIVMDRGAFSLKGRAPFRAIFDLLDRVVTRGEAGVTVSVLAAEQVGKTVLALILAARLLVEFGRNVGYFLPTDTFAHKFGRVRLKNFIKSSPLLRTAMKAADVVDQATVKEVDGHFLMILGLEVIQVSWPFDVLVNDEVDLLPAENLEWAEGRVAASDLRLTLNVSAGYAPGAGIDKRYQQGTQAKWLVKCGACRKESCLEENFPSCLAQNDRGKWRRVCPRCKADIDPDNGRWVATHPERAKEGLHSFRISSLSIGARDANHIMQRWSKARSKSKKAKFDCAERAIPNAGAMQPITDAELARMRQGYAMRLALGGRPRYAGLDMGDLCHLLVLEDAENGQLRVVWLEVIDSDEVESIVTQRVSQLGIVSLVGDKKPLTTEARALAYRFPRIVALQDFKHGSTLTVVEETHRRKKYRCVKVDRTDSLDETTAMAADDNAPLIIPDKDLLNAAQAAAVAEFEEHAKNLRKERSLDGNERPVDHYVGGGVANHLGMALNSARIAKEIALVTMPFKVRQVPRENNSPRGSGGTFTRNLKGNVLRG